MSSYVEDFNYNFIAEVLWQILNETNADYRTLMINGLLEQIYHNKNI